MTAPFSATVSKFIVNRDDIHAVASAATEDTFELAENDLVFEVDAFAFTANNVTYAAFGDRMKYWDFFPAPDAFGSVPVWGFADVVASACDDVAVGERFYGYFPMSSHLKVTVGKHSPGGFMDVAAHRSHLSPIYNFYVRTANDPGYSADGEALQMIFRPLFMTSFLIDDFLEDNDFFGAKQIILSSASSKTAYGLAFQLAQREGIKVIGLTSPANAAFVESMGSYDSVILYDDIDSIDPMIETVYVDMAGNADLRSDIHHHINNNLKYSCSVGASHWDQQAGAGDLPGAKPTLFFAPAQGQKRSQEWGADGLQKRTAAAWVKFIQQASGWTRIVRNEGLDAIEDVYQLTLRGEAKPQDGHILSF